MRFPAFLSSRWLAFWLVFSVVCLTTVWLRFQTTVELTAFLPDPQDDAEKILVQRLGQGPGSQLWFVVLPEGFADDPVAGSNAFREALLTAGLFSSVVNGVSEAEIADIPSGIISNRYLLADADFSEQGMQDMLRQRLMDMALFSNEQLDALIAVDPYLVVPELLQLSDDGSATQDWITPAGAAYLLASSRAPSFDAAGQTLIRETLLQAAQQQFGVVPELFGVGAYSSELQQTIRAEVRARSLVATLAIVVVLLMVYRRLSVLASVLPLAVGSVAALTVLTLLFDQVHGITLAFGFTLFGVAIDYPLHVLSHLRAGREQIRLIWPTLRLSVISTVAAYLLIALSGTEGLAQLGVFSAIGLLVSLLVSITLLPDLISSATERQRAAKTSAAAQTGGEAPVLRHIWLPALLLGALMMGAKLSQLWTDDLSTLSPVDQQKLERDRELRADFGIPDIRYLLYLKGADKAGVISQTAAAVAQVNAGGEVSVATAITDIVPPENIQQSRALAIHSFDASTFTALAEAKGFVSGAFAPFLRDMAAMRAGTPYLSDESWQGTALEPFVTAHLLQEDGLWWSVVTLTQVDDWSELQNSVGSLTKRAEVIDLKAASVSLVSRYRNTVIMAMCAALLAAAALLFFQIGLSTRACWVLGTIVATAALTIGLNVWLLGQLSLFNLLAVILVTGLGLDYALFLSRPGNQQFSREAVMASAFSSAAGFAVLAWSSIPILASLGLTVSSGVAIAYLLARLGQRQEPTED